MPLTNRHAAPFAGGVPDSPRYDGPPPYTAVGVALLVLGSILSWRAGTPHALMLGIGSFILGTGFVTAGLVVGVLWRDDGQPINPTRRR